MAEDFDALRTALENDSLYDTEVREGANGAIVTLLNEADTGFVFEDVPVDDVQEAAGQARLEALSADERGRLRLLRRSDDTVATSKPAIRAELLDVFAITEAQLIAGVPAVRRTATRGDAFGYKKVSLDVVRKAVRLIDKSFIVTSGQI